MTGAGHSNPRDSLAARPPRVTPDRTNSGIHPFRNFVQAGGSFNGRFGDACNASHFRGTEKAPDRVMPGPARSYRMPAWRIGKDSLSTVPHAWAPATTSLRTTPAVARRYRGQSPAAH